MGRKDKYTSDSFTGMPCSQPLVHSTSRKTHVRPNQCSKSSDVTLSSDICSIPNFFWLFRSRPECRPPAVTQSMKLSDHRTPADPPWSPRWGQIYQGTYLFVSFSLLFFPHFFPASATAVFPPAYVPYATMAAFLGNQSMCNSIQTT